MILFFDTETTGLPTNWKAPVTQVDQWPRMVQIAWMRFDNDGQILEEQSDIIFPEGFQIPAEAAQVHGITTSIARKKGVPIDEALTSFEQAIQSSRYLVAHNMAFDEKIVGAEHIRRGFPSKLFETPRFCTMKSSTDICRIPGNFGFKWPRLDELHAFLFNESFEDAHDAAVDVRICAKCYFELTRRGHFTLHPTG